MLVELCGYTPERVRELAEAGVFGDDAVSARDLVGYGAAAARTRGGPTERASRSASSSTTRRAARRTPLEGDPASEAFLHEVVGAPPTVGRRNLNTESMFEFGSRAGFWRVHRIFTPTACR